MGQGISTPVPNWHHNDRFLATMPGAGLAAFFNFAGQVTAGTRLGALGLQVVFIKPPQTNSNSNSNSNAGEAQNSPSTQRLGPRGGILSAVQNARMGSENSFPSLNRGGESGI